MSYWRQIHWAAGELKPLQLESGDRVTVSYTSDYIGTARKDGEDVVVIVEAKAAPAEQEKGDSWSCRSCNAIKDGMLNAFVMKPAEVTFFDHMRGIGKAWSNDMEKVSRDLVYVLKLSNERRGTFGRPDRATGTAGSNTIERRRSSARSDT